MNTVQLECFMAVAEHLNFSKASRELKITQPAVSHQIHALEEELGVKLFIRTSKSVTLTQEGILFVPDAQLILRTALSARERLGHHDLFIPLELGCHNSMEAKLFPPVLQRLGEEFPLLRPDIRQVPFPSLLSLVENDQLHAALGIRQDQKKSSLLFRELCSVPLACVCHPSHLQNSILVGLPPEQRYLAGSIESALTLVKARFGYTLYPDIPQAREEGLCYIPVAGLPRVTFGVYYQQKNDHPVLKRFLTLLAQNVQG